MSIETSVISTTGKPGKQPSWLENEHPEYTANKGRWRYARDHYTGEVLDSANVSKYLIKRAIGESAAAFKERCDLADYTNHFAQIVESLVGMIFAVEGDANRVWNDESDRGLGDPDDPSTPIGALWRRADNEGNGFLTVFKQLAIELAVTHVAWFFVDPANGSPVLRVLPALSVPDWTDDFSQVKVLEEVDTRTSLESPATLEKRYLVMTAAGWQRWKLDDEGKEVKLTEPGDFGTWTFSAPDGSPALPIFRISLPMRRPVGYLMAKKANAIFNKESERDNLLRVANFPRLVLAAGDEMYNKIIQSLADGANTIQEDTKDPGGGHRYIAPLTESAKIATEVIEKKVKAFHETAHKSYNDSAQERTATEVRQEVGSGTGAFLQLEKAALDDAENGALWRVEQVLFDDRARWHVAHVSRSDDFMPADPDAVMQKSATMAFGADKTVPLGLEGQVQVALQIASYRGVTVNEDEVRAEIAVRKIVDTMAIATDLSLPAEVRVDLVMKLLAAAGMIDAEAVIEMEDGTKRKRFEVLREQALALAEAKDEAARREAETIVPPATRDEDDGDLTD